MLSSLGRAVEPPVNQCLKHELWEVVMECRRLGATEAGLLTATIAALIPIEDRRDHSDNPTLLANALNRSDCYFFMCADGATPVGYLSAYQFPNVENADLYVYLFDIVVAESFRRQGVG